MLTEEQRLIRDTIRDFATKELLPYAAEWDATASFPREAIKKMGQLGLMGMLVPANWQGSGADFLSYVLAIEEIAAGDGSCSTIMSVNNSLVCASILQYGTDEQKQQFLCPLAAGDYLGAFALTEPQAGSDAANIMTTAVRTNDHYLINGVKQFITSGKEADITLVFAVTDKAAGKKGISAFIVPTNIPGYTVARLEHKMGQKASDTAQLVFDNMPIPLNYRLGKEGEGYKIALSNLEGGRIGIAAQCIGMARAALEAALLYAQSRQSFGQLLIDHQAIAFRLADMATQLEAARQMVWQAARLKTAGEPCTLQAAMAKLFASEVAEKICSAAIQIHGGYGYLQDFAVERIYRDVRVAQIYEGTSDMQRLLISRLLRENY